MNCPPKALTDTIRCRLQAVIDAPSTPVYPAGDAANDTNAEAHGDQMAPADKTEMNESMEMLPKSDDCAVLVVSAAGGVGVQGQNGGAGEEEERVLDFVRLREHYDPRMFDFY